MVNIQLKLEEEDRNYLRDILLQKLGPDAKKQIEGFTNDYELVKMVLRHFPDEFDEIMEG